MLTNLLTNAGSTCSYQVHTAVIQAIGNLSLNQTNLKELKVRHLVHFQHFLNRCSLNLDNSGVRTIKIYPD